MEAKHESDTAPASERRARDLRETASDLQREADMIAEGGGVLQPAIPTSRTTFEPSAKSRAANHPTAKAQRSSTRSRLRQRWEASLAEFSTRQLERIARMSSPRTRLQLVSERVKLTMNQAALAIELLEDFRSGKYREISWASVAALVGMVAYLINPNDVIPDVLPILGQIDDAVVVQLGVLVLRKDLRRYCEFKGYSRSEYFAA